jgi:hypothetical protein
LVKKLNQHHLSDGVSVIHIRTSNTEIAGRRSFEGDLIAARTNQFRYAACKAKRFYQTDVE